MQKILKIFEQTFWQLAGKLVSSLATFIVLGLVARSFGETGTGTYTLAVTYLAIFFLLADFGFNAHVLSRVQAFGSEDFDGEPFGSELRAELLSRTAQARRGLGFRVQDEWSKLLGTRILWSGVLVILAISLLPLWPFTTALFSQAVILGSLAIVASGVFLSCNLIFQNKLRYDLSVGAAIIGTLVWLLIVVWFIKLKLAIPYLLLSHFLGWIVIAFMALLLVKRIIKIVALKFDLNYTRRLFRESWPIAGTLVLNVVYFRADAFILSSVKGLADVGIYNVAYQIFQSVIVLPTFVMNSFYPMMLQTLKVNMDRFGRQIKLATFLLLLIAFSMLLVTYYLSPIIVKLITGGGFTGSVTSLQILSLGFPAYFLSALLMWVMVAKKMYKKMLVIYGLGLIFNLVANWIFIPQYSYIAASAITGISEYLILGMQIVIVMKSARHG